MFSCSLQAYVRTMKTGPGLITDSIPFLSTNTCFTADTGSNSSNDAMFSLVSTMCISLASAVAKTSKSYLNHLHTNTDVVLFFGRPYDFECYG